MKLVVIGLSLSSSWGNGHATTYRALLKAFAARGHEVCFLEREAPWYAAHRDLSEPGFCQLAFYDSLDALYSWRERIATADAVIVGSYTPQGVEVGRWVRGVAAGVVAFYDIDTPVTLAKLARGDHEYIDPALVSAYDVYLSFTGGPTLDALMRRHGSPNARALYCCVDADAYTPKAMTTRWDLSYLGTYSDDRQPTLERLLIAPARQAPHLRFAVAGPQYPASIDWPDNVERIDHVGPAEHPAFYGASRFTLNVTRALMIDAGYSPSVRLFEAAACGVPILSDDWPGFDSVFEPGRQALLPRDAEAVLTILETYGDADRRAVADAARERVLVQHTAAHRARELEAALVSSSRDARSPFVPSA